MSKVPKERRKLAIAEFIKLSYNRNCNTEDSLIFLRHAVRGLYEEVFGEPLDNDKPTTKEEQ